MTEALELEIERVWRDIAAGRARRKYELHLTPRGRIVDARIHVVARCSIEIGTYTREVKLADFREDVFHVFEQQRRYREAA